MLRTRAFWVGFVIVSAAAAVAAARFFPAAFPIVSLDLRMSRAQALEAAAELTARHRWGPEGYRAAASFDLDQQVQSYVELEAGGRAAFRRLLSHGPYSPYTWRVRHFREGDALETRIRFTPQGVPYGFREQLPEAAPGASLPEDRARAIAEAAARDAWGIRLASYTLVESSHQVRPGGRTDHTFVYRLDGQSLGEAEVRLRLVVGGDRLTELTNFVKVPEAFDRRLESMRSANNAIAAGASGAVLVLYLIGGVGLGLFILLRERQVMWRQALVLGATVALLQVLSGINRWPLAWMGYDTALSARTFVLQRVVQLAAEMVGLTVLLTLTFMAAEGLTRRAFPERLQLWKVWSPRVAGSPQVAGRTAAGYLLVGVFFAYEVALYFFADRVLGWWSPSEALFEPNILATYLPWLSPLAVSAQAGIWEECLFRAVPLAGAALLGRRFGRPRTWVVTALLLQAVIFGAAHANYANQPAYARLVELIVPAVGFGLLYLSFGLLPGIVLHFTYDVVWFALPLFTADVSLWGSRLMVVALTLVPVWVVVRGVVANRGLRPPPEDARNRAWSPPLARARRDLAPPMERANVSPLGRAILIAAGLVGLVVWGGLTRFTSDAPPLRVDRHGGVKRARAALKAVGLEPSAAWRPLVSVAGEPGEADRFVWDVGGDGPYHDLLGSYLAPPRLEVRFARFEGDVSERAEEFRVALFGDGSVWRVRHVVPEGRPGAQLSRSEAEARAAAAVRARFGLDVADLEAISVAPTQQPARQDWTFTWSDRRAYPLREGAAWVVAEVAGDAVADAYRTVHVAESWQRADRERATLVGVTRVAGGVVIGALLLAAAVAGIVWLSRGRMVAGTVATFFAVAAPVSLAEMLNAWPAVTAGFSTAQPYALQAVMAGGFSFLFAVLLAAVIGLVIAVAHAARLPRGGAGETGFVLPALALGGMAAGLTAVARSLVGPTAPLWGDYDPVATLVPLLGDLLGPVAVYLRSCAVVLLVLVGIDRLTAGWSRRRGAGSLLAMVAAFALSAAVGPGSLASWLGGGATGAVILLVCSLWVARTDASVIPLGVAVLVALGALRVGLLNAHPGALPGRVLAIVVLTALGWWWSRLLAARGPVSTVVP